MNIRTYDQIVVDMLDKIAERTKLTNFNVGSVIRTLVEVFGSGTLRTSITVTSQSTGGSAQSTPKLSPRWSHNFDPRGPP